MICRIVNMGVLTINQVYLLFMKVQGTGNEFITE